MKPQLTNFFLITISCKKKRNFQFFLLLHVFLQIVRFSTRSLFETSWTNLGDLGHSKALKAQQDYQIKTCSSLILTQNAPKQFVRNSNYNFWQNTFTKSLRNFFTKRPCEQPTTMLRSWLLQKCFWDVLG